MDVQAEFHVYIPIA